MLTKITNRLPKRLARFAGCERGTQLVELAIVLPVVFVLFGTAAEFGRYFYTYQTLAKATRAGSRFLTTELANGAKDQEARNLVVYGNTAGTGDPVVSGLGAGHVEIERTGASSALPDNVTVRIEGYTYQPIFDLGALMGGSFSLSVAMEPGTTMRIITATPS